MLEIKCSCENTLKLSDLSNFQGDLKTLSDDNYRKLKAQIERHGFIVPFFVWKKGKKNYILDGHQRETVLTRMKAEGIDIPDEFPVVFVEADNERDAKEKLLAINSQYGKMTETGLFDFIKEDFEFGDLSDFTLPVDMNILESMFEPMEDEHTEEELEHIPDVRETDIVIGDMFKLGRHRLLCGDCTKADDVSRLMEGKKADMVFTDPPYNMEAEGGSNQMVGKAARKLGEKIKHLCDFNPENFLNLLPILFEQNIMNSYIFCNKDLVPDYLKWARDNGYNFNILFWKKPSAIPLGGSHRPDVEYLIVIRKSAIWNNGLKDVNYSKCLEYDRVKGIDHPTVKPVALVGNEIKISSHVNGVVIDPFLGSGTTLIACEETGRTCYGIEIEPGYCQVIIDRWEKLTGKKAERI